ncbi:MAG: DUF1287 domain-containing protein [Pyrinomonadaceae bacterium]|nr:DUF1287 domain-containing protein [Pyrinomonadaceae bacterium]
MKKLYFFTRIAAFSLLAFLLSCQTNVVTQAQQDTPSIFSPTVAKPKLTEIQNDSVKKLLESAVEQTTLTKSYDPSYVVLPYPNGDVPIETGVCSDVVIRAFRKVGIDLQKEIHEDMSANFSSYPKKWGLKAADSNIDHRRVPNLQTFFTRKGKALPITDKGEDYKPGDIVAWDLDGKGITHIGLVSNIWNEKTKRYGIIHNIGGGTQAEDRIFDWKIIGHYRYF